MVQFAEASPEPNTSFHVRRCFNGQEHHEQKIRSRQLHQVQVGDRLFVFSIVEIVSQKGINFLCAERPVKITDCNLGRFFKYLMNSFMSMYLY